MSNSTNYGKDSLKNNTGDDNSAFGAYSAYNNTNSTCNTAVGSNSLFFNTTGNFNTTVGAGSMCNNVLGSSNTAIGSSALEGETSQTTVGDGNVAVGVQSLYNNSGDSNTAIGSFSLINNTSGSQNVAIGASSGPSSLYTDLTNTISIGYGAEANTSNTIQMGNSSIQQMNTYGTIGVGTYALDTAASGITGSIYFNTTDLVLKVSNGSEWNVVGLTGPTGPSDGPMGATGATGPTGIPGSAVYTGATGPTGISYWIPNGSSIYYISGNVGIGTSSPSSALEVSGTVSATSFNSLSDYRIKQEVKPLDTTYTIDKLRPVIYRNILNEKEDMGLIAHELQEVYPFLVNGEKDGAKHQSINYTSLIALLIKEMQEMKEKMQEMKEKINNLENK